jgi:hypothetical protein
VIENIREYDTLLLTGTAGNSHRFENLRCTVSTVDRVEGALKVWPDSSDPQLTGEEKFYGKLWFSVENIEQLQLVDRDHELWQ